MKCFVSGFLATEWSPLRRSIRRYKDANEARHLHRRTVLLAIAGSLATVMALRTVRAADPIRLVALGDSLTAGYGVSAKDAFPVKLEVALKAKGRGVTIANAGVSGDTSTGGADRLDWSAPDGTDGVIVELGANDMLRGLNPDVTRKAIGRILDRLKERNIPVLLTGMRAAPNLGPDFGKRYESVFTDFARERGLAFYPFFLDGVAGDRSLNQGDGIHPNPKGVDVIVEKILPTVERFLDQIEARRG